MCQSLKRCPESNATNCEAVRSRLRCIVSTHTSMYAVSQLGSPICFPVALALNGWLRLLITRCWRLRPTRHEAGRKDLRPVHLQQQQMRVWCKVLAPEKNALRAKLCSSKYFIARAHMDNRLSLFLPYGITPILVQQNIASTSYSFQKWPFFIFCPQTPISNTLNVWHI